MALRGREWLQQKQRITSERRKRGTVIKQGLGELVNLDATAATNAVQRTSATAASAKPRNVPVAPVKAWLSQQERREQQAAAGGRPRQTAKRRTAAAATDRAVGRREVAAVEASATAEGAAPERTTLVPDVALSVFGVGWEEWRAVKRGLFAPTVQERWRALHRMQSWKQRVRRHRPIPAYVEASELLVRAMLFDEAQVYHPRRELRGGAASAPSSSPAAAPAAAAAATAAVPGGGGLGDGADDAAAPGTDSAYVARTTYIGAISRAVHIMTSAGRSDGDTTYRERAKLTGFPEEAVEVRQRLAHGMQTVMLTELRWVCGLVLQHLFRHYWLVQESHVQHVEAEEQRVNEAAVQAARKRRRLEVKLHRLVAPSGAETPMADVAAAADVAADVAVADVAVAAAAAGGAPHATVADLQSLLEELDGLIAQQHAA